MYLYASYIGDSRVSSNVAAYHSLFIIYETGTTKQVPWNRVPCAKWNRPFSRAV